MLRLSVTLTNFVTGCGNPEEGQCHLGSTVEKRGVHNHGAMRIVDRRVPLPRSTRTLLEDTRLTYGRYRHA